MSLVFEEIFPYCHTVLSTQEGLIETFIERRALTDTYVGCFHGNPQVGQRSSVAPIQY